MHTGGLWPEQGRGPGWLLEASQSEAEAHPLSYPTEPGGSLPSCKGCFLPGARAVYYSPSPPRGLAWLDPACFPGPVPLWKRGNPGPALLGRRASSTPVLARL